MPPNPLGGWHASSSEKDVCMKKNRERGVALEDGRGCLLGASSLLSYNQELVVVGTSSFLSFLSKSWTWLSLSPFSSSVVQELDRALSLPSPS